MTSIPAEVQICFKEFMKLSPEHDDILIAFTLFSIEKHKNAFSYMIPNLNTNLYSIVNIILLTPKIEQYLNRCLVAENYKQILPPTVSSSYYPLSIFFNNISWSNSPWLDEVSDNVFSM